MSDGARVIGTTGGALGLGAFAATVGACCGLPWAVALLGVSGAVALARLSFLLPYALIGAAALLAVAFWWAYRPPPVCSDGACNPANRLRLRGFVWAAAVLVVGLATVALAQSPVAHGPTASYTVLDDQASQLRADFNRERGTVRLLFVVDPICPECLRGLDDMNRDLLRGTADPRLQIFVVHEPVLGVARHIPGLHVASEHDVVEAAQLIQNPNAHHYWNKSGTFGRLLSSAVRLENGGQPVYAWDVWLLYGPDAQWGPGGPPPPDLLMHQLSALRGSTQFPFLDSQAFARQVRALLARMPPPEGATALATQAPH
ncbi:MAG: hypothetical protein WA747_02875 [Steroidobacteraceae bacterium]